LQSIATALLYIAGIQDIRVRVRDDLLASLHCTMTAYVTITCICIVHRVYTTLHV